ncbi:MAG: hypothetical protein LBG18_01860 [Mediterranea sp.]|jgi:hypothetical protein|nr:hypothetical protein [Mediterranea sp.]
MAGKLNKWDKRHLLDMAGYAKEIDRLYQEAVREAARISATVPDFNPDKPFSFAQYPAIKERVEKLINGLSANVTTVLGNGVVTQWNLANKKNDELAGFIFGNKAAKLPEDKQRQYFSNNNKALEAFQARKTAGLNLSDRVWNYTDQFKTEIEFGLDFGIREGLSSAEIARDLKQYLKAPDKLFRRVRDEHGELQLSKNAKNYHPGAGVYRSSYKNAMRLARTETNMAYRTSDHTRWQQMDFVVGIEIHLSNNHTLNGRAFTDICDELQGKYPKTFKFTGWHPACRCFATTILKTEEELEADNERIMNGEEPSEDSANMVKDVPDNFKKWVTDNETRIIKANEKGSLPYFLKDNRSAWKDYTSIELINKQVVSKTVKYADSLNAESAKLAEKHGVSVTPVNIKSEKRIFDKAIAEYYGDIFKVNDIIRNTFIASEDKIPAVIAEIEKRFKVIKHKSQSDNTGYTGDLFKILVQDGIKGEIQVNTPQMIYAKETYAKEMLGTDLFNNIKEKSGLQNGLGHKYYEEYRQLSKAEQMSKKGRDLASKSKVYYEKIRAVKL